MLTRIRAQLPLWRRALRRRRRTLAVLAAALTLALLAPALLPPGMQGAPVVVADAEIPAGTVLEPQHLRTVHVAAELVPPGAVSAATELLGRETTRVIPAETPVQRELLSGARPPDVPAGSALMVVPIPDVLAPRLTPGAQIELIVSSPDGTAPLHIPASVVELPATTLEDPSVLGQGSSGQSPVVVAVDRARSGELSHSLAEGWLSISLIG